jgi:hypothetical protein
MAIQMTPEERRLLKEWNARLTAEGLGMSRGLPPRKVKLTSYIEEIHGGYPSVTQPDPNGPEEWCYSDENEAM